MAPGLASSFSREAPVAGLAGPPAGLAGRPHAGVLVALRLASMAGLLIALRVDASVLIALRIDAGGLYRAGLAGGLSRAGLAGPTASCVTARATGVISGAKVTGSPWPTPDSSADSRWTCTQATDPNVEIELVNRLRACR